MVVLNMRKTSRTVAKDVEIFESMIEALKPLGIWGLSTADLLSSSNDETAQPTWRSKGIVNNIQMDNRR